jgi:DNA-binding MarR family transcriptional regulator
LLSSPLSESTISESTISESTMDAELVARLRGVIPRLARELNETSTGEGLTPTQYSVLALVRSRGPLGLAELTELEGLNPTMVSRIIKVLDEGGLIVRMPDPQDLRAARLAATPAGEQVHDRVRAQRTQVLSDCLGRLPADTASTLLAAVPAMEALAEAVKRGAGAVLARRAPPGPQARGRSPAQPAVPRRPGRGMGHHLPANPGPMRPKP